MIALLIAGVVCWFTVYAYRVLGGSTPSEPKASSKRNAQHLVDFRDEIEIAFRNEVLVLGLPFHPSPITVGGDRWTQNPGAIPGEPMAYLDGDDETGLAAVVEILEDGSDFAKFEARLVGGKVLGLFGHPNDAADLAESVIDSRRLAA